jgi:O-antigen/teichoic acid export membrane protein
MMKKNIFTISAITYAGIVIIFLTQVMIVNMVSVSDYGVYATLIAIISLIEAPLVSRSSELVMKRVGEKWNNNHKDDALAIITYIIHTEKKLFISVFLAIVMGSLLWSYFWELNVTYLIILAVSIPLQIGYAVYKGFLIIINEVYLQSLTEVSFSILTLTLSFIGLFLFGIVGLFGSIVISAYLKTQISKYIYKKQLLTFNVEVAEDHNYEIEKLEYSRRSINSMFKIFTQNGITQIDIMLLGVFQKPEIVAVYKVGKSLAGLPTKVSIPIWRYFYPGLVKAVNTHDLNSRRETIAKGSAIVLFLFSIVYLCSYFVGEYVIDVLYGRDYVEAYTIFMILLLGYGFFYAVNGWFKVWVALIDKMTIGSRFYLVAFLLTALLSYIFYDNVVHLSVSITLMMTAMTCYSYFIGMNKKY